LITRSHLQHAAPQQHLVPPHQLQLPLGHHTHSLRACVQQNACDTQPTHFTHSTTQQPVFDNCPGQTAAWYCYPQSKPTALSTVPQQLSQSCWQQVTNVTHLKWSECILACLQCSWVAPVPVKGVSQGLKHATACRSVTHTEVVCFRSVACTAFMLQLLCMRATWELTAGLVAQGGLTHQLKTPWVSFSRSHQPLNLSPEHKTTQDTQQNTRTHLPRCQTSIC
jgi:hypothetical protein